jgi:hypothetical protein
MSGKAGHINQKQLKTWLSKPPGERLRLTLENNQDLFKLWDEMRKNHPEPAPFEETVMGDTPAHIKQKQLQIWLSKPPGERLGLTLTCNDDLYKLWAEMKKEPGVKNQEPG